MNNKVDSSTIIRTIIWALSIVNMWLSATGHAVLPIEDATIENVVSGIWITASSINAWWKNNSFTVAAKAGDKVKTAVKKGDISASAVDNMLK